VIDRFILMALTPMTLAGGALGWTSLRDDDSTAFVGQTSSTAVVSDDNDATTADRHRITRADDGLFHARVRVNGHPLRMIIDTGATTSILSSRDAARVPGVDVSAATIGTMRTLGGERRYRGAIVDSVRVGSKRIANIDFAVIDTPGHMSIIGQDVLRELGPIVLDGDTLTLP
jgi:aspartyl protease family protein